MIPQLFVALFLTLSFAVTTFSQSFTVQPALLGNLNFVEVNEAHGVAITGGIETFVSTDNGWTWTEIDDQFGTTMYPFETLDATIINGTTYCLLARNVFNNTYSVLRTIDGGLTWSVHITSASLSNTPYYDIDYNGNAVIVATNGGVYRSTNSGGTWTFVSVSSGSGQSNFVVHNETNGNFIVGGYSAGYSTSSNNGLTWADQTIGSYNGSNTVHGSTRGDSVLLTHNENNETSFITLSTTFTLLDEIVLNDFYFGNPIAGSHHLVDGNILAWNGSGFYTIDKGNQFVYYHTHQLGNGSSVPNDVDVGITYGLAVGNSGTLSRIDLTQPGTMYVPANFSILTNPDCPGTLMEAEALYPFADSVKWFYDGVLVSNSNQLNFNTPNTFGAFDLTLETWFNGNSTVETTLIDLPSPLPPYSYSAIIDSTLCYDEQSSIFLGQLPSSNTSTFIEMLIGNQSFYGSQLLPTSSTTIMTPNLQQSDTLYIITTRPQLCATTADTLSVFIQVAPDLSQFTSVTAATEVCEGEGIQLDITNMLDSAEYTFTGNLSNGNSYNSQGTITGIGNDTLSVNLGAVNYTSSGSYGNDYLFIQVQVLDTNGCTYNGNFETIEIIIPDVKIGLLSNNYFYEDTVIVENNNVAPNRLWTVTGTPQVQINNETAPTPDIFGDTLGHFLIDLVNAPIANCSDTGTVRFFFCDTLPSQPNPICNTYESDQMGTILFMEMDPFGNTYVIGLADPFPLAYNFLRYTISKFDAQGNFLWRKIANNGGNGSQLGGGSVISGIDFDAVGNPYIITWCYNEGPYNSGYFSHTSGFNSDHVGGYISQLDPSTGDLVWFRDVRSYPIPINSNVFWRVTNILVEDNTIYFTYGTKTSLNVAATTLTGNFISGSFDAVGVFSAQSAFPISTYFSSNQTKNGYLISPDLKMLSTGEVVVVSRYQNFSNSWNTLPGMSTVLDHALLGFKYTIQDGTYDLVKIGEGFIRKPHVLVDNNDNIITVFECYSDYAEVRDSVLNLQKSATVLLEMDSDFDLNWISLSLDKMNIRDMKYASVTESIFLAARCKDNVGFGKDTVFRMVGDYASSTSLNSAKESGFIAEFDSNGYMHDAHWYQIPGDTSISDFNLQFAVSPCSDVVGAFQSTGTTSTTTVYELEMDGVIVPIDSAKVIGYYNNCSANLCQVFDLEPSDTICSNETAFDVLLENSFGANTIDYLINDGVSQIASGTAAVSNQGTYSIPVPTNSSNSMELITTSPLPDTVSLIIEPPLNTQYTHPDTICFLEDLVITASPPSYNYSWYHGNLITGTSIVIPFSSYYNGQDYYMIDVYVSDANGCSRSDTIIGVIDPCISDASVSELGTEIDVNIHPNPSFDGKFTVTLNQWDINAVVNLVSATGAVIDTHNINMGDNEIQFQVAPGNYWLEFASDSYLIRRKVVIM